MAIFKRFIEFFAALATYIRREKVPPYNMMVLLIRILHGKNIEDILLNKA